MIRYGKACLAIQRLEWIDYHFNKINKYHSILFHSILSSILVCYYCILPYNSITVFILYHVITALL